MSPQTVVLAALIGVLSGLRTFTPIAAVSWAARLRVLPLDGTLLAFLGYAAAPYILTLVALFELFVDKLPRTPSRTRRGPLAGRIVSGSVAGAAIALSQGSPWSGFFCGALGAVVGTFGGAAIRGRLASTFRSDVPAALLEDAVCIAGSIAVLSSFST